MYYIAYGSNLNLDQMAFRCPHSQPLCRGILRGWKLVFNVHADIIETGNPEDAVPVLVWLIAKSDWKNLDRYEGYPVYYVKRVVKVELENAGGEPAEAANGIVYVMAEDRKGVHPPYQDYFNVIEQGCNQNGIGVDYLYNAVEESYEYIGEYDRLVGKYEVKAHA